GSSEPGPSRSSRELVGEWLPSAELDGRVLLQLLESVLGLDEPDGARPRAHHERLGGGPALLVADALQQLPIGDAGCGEEAVVASHQTIGVQDLVEVVTGVDGRLALGVVTRPQPTLDGAAHGL